MGDIVICALVSAIVFFLIGYFVGYAEGKKDLIDLEMIGIKSDIDALKAKVGKVNDKVKRMDKGQ